MSRTYQIVLDTNVLIAALRSRRGASFELLQLVGDERWQLHLSTALLLEYEAVARREVQHLWLQPDLIEAVLDYLCANAQEHRSVFAGARFFPIRLMTSFWSWPWLRRHSILLRITCATSQALKLLAWKQ